jgi:CHAT domain-containing protein
VNLRLGKLAEALAEQKEAIRIWGEVGDKGGKAESVQALADIHLAMGDRATAEQTYQEALALCRQVGNRTWEAKSLAGLARVARENGDLLTAKTRIEEALQIVETLRSRVAAPELRSTYFATVEELYDFYVDVLLRLNEKEPGKGHDAEALRASESARARSFLESFAELRADIRRGVDPALLSREKAARDRLQGKEQFRVRVLQGPHGDAQAKEAEEALAAALADLQKIEEEIRRTSPAYAALSQPKPVGLHEIQAQLDGESVLLEYALGDEASYVFAVTNDALAVKKLPRQKEVDALARELRTLVSARNDVRKGETLEARKKRVDAADAAWPAKAAALSKAILSPVASALAGKRVVLVRDGVLHYLPFAALPDPSDPKGAPLVVSHEVVDLPSATFLATLRQIDPSRKAPDRLVAVLADPVFERDDARLSGVVPKGDRRADSMNEEMVRSASESGIDGFSRLRFTRKEAETISALAPKEERLAALDFSASRATATSPELSRYRIVHFATHGLVNGVHPALSGLVLSLVDDKGSPEDGFLRLHDIYNMKLSADLVVLSACQTALGREIRGEGLVGLTRGFMYAGAPRVVASLWSVQDRATAELMKRFYDGMLAEKLPAAAALRKAQSSMAREPRFASPYFWAAFELEGEWR